MTPKGWTIARRGDRWIVTFENSKFETPVEWTEGMYLKFISDSAARLGLKIGVSDDE